MSRNKFGSMFDDDDDLESSPQASSAAPAEEPAPDHVGLINDEAAALLDAKAKQAAEQAQRAAKAGLAAASRAADVLKGQGKKLKEKAQTTGESSKRPMVIGLVSVAVVVVGAISWWVWSRDAGHAETRQPEVPVVVIPAAGGAVEPQAAEQQHEPGPVDVEQAPAAEQPEPMPAIPVIPPAGGGFVQQPTPASPTPAQNPRAEASRVPPISVVEDMPPERGTTPKAEPALRPPTSPTVAVRAQLAKRTSTDAASHESEIGSREKQQIDQIHALFGDQP